jgi:hypothetical protein
MGPKTINWIDMLRIRNTSNALMGPGVIEVVNVFAHQSLQVALTEDNDMIQALTPDTADEALANRIRVRRARWCSEHINSSRNM